MVQIIQFGSREAAFDGCPKCFGQLALLIQKLEKSYPLIQNFAVMHHALVNQADLGLVQSARSFFAVMDDERARGALFKERDGGGDRVFRY